MESGRQFIRGDLSEDAFYDLTTGTAFRYVLDVCHRLPGGESAVRFYADKRKQRRGLVLTNALHGLYASGMAGNLENEVEARWRLVESAWGLGLTRAVLPVEYDRLLSELYIPPWSGRVRVGLTSVRGALSDYQKGHCFYCFASIDAQDGQTYHVDHFFPWVLGEAADGLNMDGVWNLVLACRHCNLGVGGKFDATPEQPYLERLHRRNSDLIASHHPLRDTLMAQTGQTEPQRRAFLQAVDRFAFGQRGRRWRAGDEREGVFQNEHRPSADPQSIGGTHSATTDPSSNVTVSRSPRHACTSSASVGQSPAPRIASRSAPQSSAGPTVQRA